MAKQVLLEEFHLTAYARVGTTDAERERLRRILASRAFRAELRTKIAEAIASRFDLRGAVIRLSW